MKNYKNEIIVGGLLAVLFGGAIFWFVKHEPEATLKIVIAGLLTGVGLITFITKLIKRRRDIKENMPAEDEFTDRVKLHAGSTAFLYSMYLWLGIFVFNTSFSNNEEMIGGGILGSSVIYFILYWYYRSTSVFPDEK